MANLAPVSVRVSEKERELLEAAAEQSRTNLSDFIRRKAVEAAEMELLHQDRVTIAAVDWKKFEAWVDSPPKKIRPWPSWRRVVRHGATEPTAPARRKRRLRELRLRPRVHEPMVPAPCVAKPADRCVAHDGDV